MNKNESKYFNTAKKMNDALIALLYKKDFEYITIKEICDLAGVNRSTFYLHYLNMNDLLEEVISSLNTSFNSHLNNNENIKSILQRENVEDLYLIKDEYLVPYLEFIKENKNVYKALKNNTKLFKTDSTYNKMYKLLFEPILDRFGLDNKWHKYIMDFYINGISAFVLDWVNDGCKISTEEVAKFIQGLIVKHN